MNKDELADYILSIIKIMDEEPSIEAISVNHLYLRQRQDVYHQRMDLKHALRKNMFGIHERIRRRC